MVQYQVQSPVLESFDHRELERPPSNLVLGASGRVGSTWGWDVSFQEDLPADTPAMVVAKSAIRRKDRPRDFGLRVLFICLFLRPLNGTSGCRCNFALQIKMGSAALPVDGGEIKLW